MRLVRRLPKAGQRSNTPQFWVEDASGNVISSVVEPDAMGGADMVNVPFTPSATGIHYLKLSQSGSVDASCRLSQIEYRLIPSDGNTRLMPTDGTTTTDARGRTLPQSDYVWFAGDSNSLQAQAIYVDGIYTQSLAMFTPGVKATADMVSGRFIEQQAYESRLYLVNGRQYAMGISQCTGNTQFRELNGYTSDQSPFSPNVVSNTTTYKRGLWYWMQQAAAQCTRVLVIGKLRRGYDDFYDDPYNVGHKFEWKQIGKTAAYNRVTRDMLNWNRGSVPGNPLGKRSGSIALHSGGFLKGYEQE